MGSAKYIGRIGALAVALGIGTGVATAPWVAVAEPSDSGSSSESASESGGPSAEQSESSATQSSTDSASASDSTSATGVSASEASVAANESAPPVVVRSSGGAHTSSASSVSETKNDDRDESSEFSDSLASAESTTLAGEEAGENAATLDEITPVVEENAPPAGVAAEVTVVQEVPPEPDATSESADTDSTASTAAGSDFGRTAQAAPATMAEVVDPTASIPDKHSAQSTAIAGISIGVEPDTQQVGEPVPTPSVETEVVAAPVSPPPTPLRVVSEVVSSALALVGLSPAIGTTPVAPVESPALWAVLAWARRPSGQALTASGPAADPVTTSHTVDGAVTGDQLTSTVTQTPTGAVAARDISGTMAVSTTASANPIGDLIGGLVGGLLHLLFNNPPTTSYDPADNSQAADGVITGTLNAADPNGDALTFTVTQAPEHGTVVVNGPDGTFTYTPEAGFARTGGTDSFTVEVADNHPSLFSPAGVTLASVSVTVDAVNQPPVVGDPAFTIDHVDPLTGVVTGSVNVADPDADPLTYSLTTGPDSAQGSVVVDPETGDWTYTPTLAARLKATDITATADDQQVSFTIGASDGIAEAVPVAVTTTVTPLDVTTIDVGDHPSWVAVSPDGRYAYITNAYDNDDGGRTVSVIDIPTNEVVDTIDVCDDCTGVSGPSGIAVSPDGQYAYITLPFEDSVVTVDTTTNQVVGDIVVRSPARVAFSPDGNFAYVTTTNNTVSVIATATGEVVGNPIPVGAFPVMVAVRPDGAYAYVPNSEVDTVSVIDIDVSSATYGTVVDTLDVGDRPVGVAVSPDGSYAYVTNFDGGTVSVIDTTTNEVVGAPILLGGTPAGVAVSPDGNYVYVTNSDVTNPDEFSTVSVINTATNEVVATIAVGMFPGWLAVSPDGTHVYVISADLTNPDAPGAVSVITVLPSPSDVV